MSIRRKHSGLSPSSAARWMACPGSVILSRFAPAPRQSEAAREGTDAHECLAFLARRYGAIAAAKAEALEKWPREMVESGVSAISLLFSSDLRPSESAKILIEHPVRIRLGNITIPGRVDFAWAEKFGTLLVADYKYGCTNPVSAYSNPQVMLYALGLAQEFDYNFERILVAIIQPRMQAFSVESVSFRRLREFADEARVSADIALSPGAPLVPGAQCRFCPAASICKRKVKTILRKQEEATCANF